MDGVLRKWPLALPWAPIGRRGRTQTCRRDRVWPARGRTPALSLISPAHEDAKLEYLEGLPGGRLGTARHYRPYLSDVSDGSTVTSCSRAKPAVPGTVRAQRPQEVDTPERGPVGVAKIKLRVCALPQQEATEALLT